MTDEENLLFIRHINDNAHENDFLCVFDDNENATMTSASIKVSTGESQLAGVCLGILLR